jgi:putative metalloenzyme radical SAM/SPASM domain maturase
MGPLPLVIETAAPESPALKDHPSKLFVETTTRCNLACPMCVKQTWGGDAAEGSLAPAVYERLLPAFPRLETLILNGIGEPLLHPRLDEFIRTAKNTMPAGSWVGFQSNGLLIDRDRARSLVAAGLDRICISVDSVDPAVYRTVRSGGEFGDLERAFSVLLDAKGNVTGSTLRVGIEFVVMRDNLRQLPGVLRWAARHGVGFAVATHLLPYHQAMASNAAYDANTDSAIALFSQWREKASREGIDLHRYPAVFLKYGKTAEDVKLVETVEAMKTDAVSRGVFLHLEKLFGMSEARAREVQSVFDEARAVAAEVGIDLELPLAVPKSVRKCDFVEEGSAFVSWDGNVHPCYFLWHRYRCFLDGHEKLVKPKVFGNLPEQGVLDIWNSPAYRRFRENVIGYDYPYCFNCSFALCDYVQTDDFEQDCYVNTEPCAACLWCQGVFHCLR